MSIEKALADLTEALNANTAALLKTGGTAAPATADSATEKRGPGRPKKEDAPAPASAPAAPKAPTRTQEEMVAALEEVKDKISLDAAKKIISEVGGVDKRKDIPADKYAAVYDAAKAAVEAADEGM